MNEYNHHRIISRVVAQLKTVLGLSDEDVDNMWEIFKNASDFSDAADPFSLKSVKDKYYFYLYYYNVNVRNNKITLSRVVDNSFTNNASKTTIESCGEMVIKNKLLGKGNKTEIVPEWSHWTNEKEFFSSVNGRKKSSWEGEGKYDIANQSDNVAFLHAMGAEDENPKVTTKAEDVFKKHLRRCFTEFLFLENENDALRMLGIALHGIMDSFTPSHMGFQQYSKQDHDFHAQGDVIPIKGVFDKNEKLISCSSDDYEAIYFDPGQDEKVGVNNEGLRLCNLIHFNGDDNVIYLDEYYMLRIFFYIGELGRWKDNTIQPLKKEEIEEFWTKLKGNDKKTINEKLLLGRYCYGEGSYMYSENAISVIVDICKELILYRRDLFKKSKADRYNHYVSIKDTAVSDAVNKWVERYLQMEDKRKKHLELDLYTERQEVIDDRNRRYREFREAMAKAMIDNMY